MLPCSYLDGALVYEVAFMVAPSLEPLQLSHVKLLFCNEKDMHDSEFGGRCQVCVEIAVQEMHVHCLQ